MCAEFLIHVFENLKEEVFSIDVLRMTKRRDKQQRKDKTKGKRCLRRAT